MSDPQQPGAPGPAGEGPLPPPPAQPPPPPPGTGQQPFAEPAYGAPPGAAQRAPIVGNGKRFGAWLLELLLLIVTLTIGWVIWSLIVWRDGRTPAKSLLNMRCVKADTWETATWGTMALREIVGKWLIGSITGGITTIISAFMILFSETRQGIWDYIANTVVVDES